MIRFVFGIIFLVMFVVFFTIKVVFKKRAQSRNAPAHDIVETSDTWEGRGFRRQVASEPVSDKSPIFGVLSFVFLTLGVLLIVSSFARVVPANTVGIPTTVGKVGDPMNSGFQVVLPWTDITQFSTRTQELSMLRAADEGDKSKDDSVDVIAAGGGSMKVDITVRFRIQKEEAANLFKLAGTLDLVKDRFVRPDAREVVRNVFGLYSAEAGYSTARAEISLKITDELRKQLAGKGITIDSVNVRDVLPEAQVLESINAILRTRNDAAKAAEDQKKQITEAETRKEVAARDAEAKVTAANGDAKAVEIAATAQANANTQIAQSLTPELLDLEKTKACADAIAQSSATVINVCGNAQATPSGASSGSAVIVDGRATSSGG